MSGIIEDESRLSAISLGDVLHPVDFRQHIVEGGILADMQVAFRNAEQLDAVFPESHTVVEGKLHVHFLLVILVGDDYGKGLLLLHLRNGNVQIHVRFQIACQRVHAFSGSRCLRHLPGSNRLMFIPYKFLGTGGVGSHYLHQSFLAHRDSLRVDR